MCHNKLVLELPLYQQQVTFSSIDIGNVVVAGYFSNAEATASTVDAEGWLKTGDLCYIDDDGFIFVVDRLKELIKYKGYQVRH